MDMHFISICSFYLQLWERNRFVLHVFKLYSNTFTIQSATILLCTKLDVLAVVWLPSSDRTMTSYFVLRKAAEWRLKCQVLNLTVWLLVVSWKCLSCLFWCLFVLWRTTNVTSYKSKTPTTSKAADAIARALLLCSVNVLYVDKVLARVLPVKRMARCWLS